MPVDSSVKNEEHGIWEQKLKCRVKMFPRRDGIWPQNRLSQTGVRVAAGWALAWVMAAASTGRSLPGAPESACAESRTPRACGDCDAQEAAGGLALGVGRPSKGPGRLSVFGNPTRRAAFRRTAFPLTSSPCEANPGSGAESSRLNLQAERPQE